MPSSLFPSQTVGGPWLLGCSLLTIALDAALLGLWFVGPQFEALYAGFGAQMPPLSAFVLAHYRWGAVLVILVSVAGIALVKARGKTLVESRWVVASFLVASLAAASAVGIFVISMYLPIFEMGSVV